MRPETDSHAKKEALVFGPQILSFSQGSATTLRSQLLSHGRFSWVRRVLGSLSSHWDALASADHLLRSLDGKRLLDDLATWLQTGDSDILSFPLPNILLTPLVVALHLVQYQTILDVPGKATADPSFSASETLGLCIGHLSAAAVSCSKDPSQIEHYGSVAVRIAMLIGAFVDVRDASMNSHDRAKSFSVVWGSQTNDSGNLEEILQDFPQDETRITLTTPSGTAPRLVEKLQSSGFGVTALSLRGYFHWQGYEDELSSIIDFCERTPDFRFVQCSDLTIPTRSTATGEHYDFGALHRLIVRSILVEQSNWKTTFHKLVDSLAGGIEPELTCIGPEPCIPLFVSRGKHIRLRHVNGLDGTPPKSGGSGKLEPDGDFIAVTGMACQVPGASDMAAFWSILSAGKSQHVEVPAERFGFDTPWRNHDARRKWYGNFVENYDKFDEKFFGKNPRESASTDPQHRLMLQVAYQAVEQSGYFRSPCPNKSVGCYIGVGLSDYEDNVACHAPTAYTAIGNLRSFAAGRISHYFGWTGPGLTIDTACSSSAVAIHNACRAILSGDCHSALAGGVNIMTGATWFQNLAAASFLSPTGQCKPFDQNADGYCRGEAVGAVFLKKLSSAVADGDAIFGVIAGSSVQQNQNCTAITVPNGPSLSDLFSDVIQRSHLSPEDISYAEAHGTGTPVGDPVEYNSIRQVLGGERNHHGLTLGSVKGLVGHSEAASGVVALLKVLLMMNHQSIPPQASFRKIRSDIGAQNKDNIRIATDSSPWTRDFKAALINNYGASGSNAALIVSQSPNDIVYPQPLTRRLYPGSIFAFDEHGLQRYCSKLLSFIKSNKSLSPADVAFQLSRQSNWSLSHSLVFSFSTTGELAEKLESFDINGSNTKVGSNKCPRPRSLVLCFGGQISKFVGLDIDLYEEVNILRKHLDVCSDICESLGSSLYPAIFQTTPLNDGVQLQLALFSLQYACAQSWIECGVNVAAVIGHSFGELTALCISGVLSLTDALKVVARRAQLVRDYWGNDKGCMAAIKGNLVIVERLLIESQRSCPEEPAATIACFNGEFTFTIAGSTKAIDAVFQIASGNAEFSSVDIKQLDVTNAFHCSLVDPILGKLRGLTQDITFHTPVIPIEFTTKIESQEHLQHDFFANHMRQPVYFSQAVQRLSKRFPSSIWLEAGSNSTVTVMAKRALDSKHDNHFQPVNITVEGAFNNLTNVTTGLWRQGLNVCFWPHNKSQVKGYRPTILPPYQFKMSRHWMALKPPQNVVLDNVQSALKNEPRALWTLNSPGADSHQSRSYKFRVHADSVRFGDVLKSHVLLQAYPLCPSTLQLDIVIDALVSLRPEYTSGAMQPRLLGVHNHTPMTSNPGREVWIDAKLVGAEGHVWDWEMRSEGANNNGSVLHVLGRAAFYSLSDQKVLDEFAVYERLVRKSQCRDLLGSWDADEILQGRSIYRAFSTIVEYGDIFCGLRKLVGKGNESAGHVSIPYSGESWFKFALADCFCQVAGIYINAVAPQSADELFISDKIGQWFRSPRASYEKSQPTDWEVYSCHSQPSPKEYLSDIFVFDPKSGSLLEVIIGVHYQKVSKTRFGKVLSKVSSGGDIHPSLHSHSVACTTELNPVQNLTNGTSRLPQPAYPADKSSPSTSPMKASISPQAAQIKGIVANLSGLDTEEIKDDTDLGDIGIDSLMVMEVARELEGVFKCTINISDFEALEDFKSLVRYIEERVGIPNGNHDAASPNGDDEVPRMSNTEQALSLNDHLVHSVSNGHFNGMANGFERLPHANSDSGQLNAVHLPMEHVLDTFLHHAKLTDEYITAHGLAGYVDEVVPRLDQLCIAYIRDAFGQLQYEVESLPHLPRHRKFVDLLRGLLNQDSQSMDLGLVQDPHRNSDFVPTTSSTALLLNDLREHFPAHCRDYDLIELVGGKLAECLDGRADAIQIMFGSHETKDVVSAMYGQSPINVVWITQLKDFLRSLISRLPPMNEPLKIFEIGAGTGGTTAKIIPILLEQDIPIQYTVTDISSSLVAASRKRFRQYDWVKYRVFDLERPIAEEILGSQHIVLATNCVHVTRNLEDSASRIRSLLRPDGLLIMLEMTQRLAWIDLIFGLLEGWWQFNDGRDHALAPVTVWKDTLTQAGYKHVEWTDGTLPEAAIQRLILATAASSQRSDECDPLVAPLIQSIHHRTPADIQALQDRETAVETYTHDFTVDLFPLSPLDDVYSSKQSTAGRTSVAVLITGATGSLGSHLVQYMAENPEVTSVICLNRRHSTAADVRQTQALKSRGIHLSPGAFSKLKVFQTDILKPMLGLSQNEYEYLCSCVTHIVHNAWPMSVTRLIRGYEAQFKTMRNLLVLARDAFEALRLRSSSGKITFQFISSIAVVGLDPLRSGQTQVLEERMPVASVLPNGYGDAKLVCERMLDDTLGQYPNAFRSMAVRLGQVAGSRVTGYWNPDEHFSFMVKSAQTLGALPSLKGTLSWCPVTDCAAALSTLLLSTAATHSVYHIDNPIRQPWPAMIEYLRKALHIPSMHVIPFDDWIERLRRRVVKPMSGKNDNNSTLHMIDFLESHFVRMSCGGVVLDLTKSMEDAEPLRNMRSVDRDLVEKYVQNWKNIGFLD